VLYANKPTLTATENEYLLFIHPEIKERAKVIRGYRWDPERRCWVYPRTKQVLDALVAEFGEEIGKAAKVRPTAAQAAPSAEALQARIEELERDNAGLREALNQSVDIWNALILSKLGSGRNWRKRAHNSSRSARWRRPRLPICAERRKAPRRGARAPRRS
jgi:hypothetical protein